MMKGWILDMTNVSLTQTTHTHTTRSQTIHTDSQSTQKTQTFIDSTSSSIIILSRASDIP